MILKELSKLGYKELLIFKDSKISYKSLDFLDSDSLFFVDGGYLVDKSYIFAISAPKYELKGVLVLDKSSYKELLSSNLASKFNIVIEQNPKDIVIRRQYGLRKVLKDEFDKNRFILRVGFPNFPKCPYGHTFRALGYDLESKTYVRLHRSILKQKDLKVEEYKEIL